MCVCVCVCVCSIIYKIWHSCGLRCDFISVSFIPFSYIWECFLDPSRIRRCAYTLSSVIVPCAKQTLKTRWVPLSVGDSRNMYDWGKKRPLNTSTLNQLAIAMFIYSHISFFFMRNPKQLERWPYLFIHLVRWVLQAAHNI